MQFVFPDNMWAIIGVLTLAGSALLVLVWAACTVVNKRRDREEGVYDVERAERSKRPQPQQGPQSGEGRYLEPPPEYPYRRQNVQRPYQYLKNQ